MRGGEGRAAGGGVAGAGSLPGAPRPSPAWGRERPPRPGAALSLATGRAAARAGQARGPGTRLAPRWPLRCGWSRLPPAPRAPPDPRPPAPAGHAGPDPGGAPRGRPLPLTRRPGVGSPVTLMPLAGSALPLLNFLL